MKHLLLMLLVALVAACSNSVIVSSPLEAPSDPYQGAVRALSEQLKGKSEAFLVFIHGVGDHCPGYALSPQFGWLDDKAIKAMGLETSDAKPTVSLIYDAEFLPGHAQDPASLVSYAKRDFTYMPDAAGSKKIVVHAIEITWSQLTQWVKTNQLDYDLTEPAEHPQSLVDNCPYKTTATYKKPPGREKLNRVLKESTLDHSLVDAVLYAGEYGTVMRRGMAEALCRSLGGTRNSNGSLCNWPESNPAQGNDTAYFFVTHSLGSRLLYDTILSLEGHDVSSIAHTFTAGEQASAAPFVRSLAVKTASIYMMANQLPLLGLAYEEGHASSDAPHPLSVLMRNEAIALNVTSPGANVDLRSTSRNKLQPSVNGYVALRAQVARNVHVSVPKLTVVAFSDPNDLLSWGIPKWYQAPPDGVTPYADFTNVYLKNSPHWFGLIENPADAHAGYFVSEDVWHVIRCGASKGKVIPCA